MKRLLIRLLEKVGLVTAGRYALLTAKLRDVEARAKKLRDVEARAKKLATQVEEIRAESKTWEAKASKALKQLETASKDAAHQAQRIEKHRTEEGKLREQLVRARAGREELEAVRARLADAERELAVAREHLMAIEVKLDILEGAANVLDTRTRSVIAQRAGKIGVAV